MIRTSLLTSVLCVLLCLPLSGCSDRDHKRGSASATPPPPANGGGASATGTVSLLTGDDDSQVTPALQQLVADSIARGDADEPLDF